MPPKGFLGWLQSNRDGLIGTFLVAVVLCLACSAMVSVAAVSLRDTQLRNKEVDRKKNILLAAGLCESGAKASEVDAIYADRIRESLIDLDTGEPETSDLVDGASYDPRKAAKDPALSEPISDGSLAGIARREKFASVYEIVEGEQTQGFIFPIYGKGLWSTLYGFIALEADGQTVRGITFYEHAETPGLGGEVDNAKWKASWNGKVARQDGEVVIQVLKGKVVSDSPSANRQIDGLSGATITTKGVDNLVRYWLGDNAFGAYLAARSSGGGSHDGHDHGDHEHDSHDGEHHDDHDQPKTASVEPSRVTIEGESRG